MMGFRCFCTPVGRRALRRCFTGSRSDGSRSDQGKTYWEQFVDRLPGEQMTGAAALGFGAMCCVALQRRWQEGGGQSAGSDDTGAAPSPASSLATPRQMSAISLVPFQMLSRAWGLLASIPVPRSFRPSLYEAWAALVGADLAEAALPLHEYRSLSALVSRKLHTDARTILRDPLALTAPCDGVVVACGPVQYRDVGHSSGDGGGGAIAIDEAAGKGRTVAVLEQVKGVNYRLDRFLGEALGGAMEANTGTPPETAKQRRLYFVTTYIPRGAYHRVHSPADWSALHCRRFTGELFPTAPWASALIPSLLQLNERLVLTGAWRHGFFAVVPVGGYGAGSIALTLSGGDSDSGNSGADSFFFSRQQLCARGEELVAFSSGSTVVVVFEAPDDFEFTVSPGSTVEVGQELGRISGRSTPPAMLEEWKQRRTTFPTASAIVQLATKNSRGGADDQKTGARQHDSNQSVDSNSDAATSSAKAKPGHHVSPALEQQGVSKSQARADEYSIAGSIAGSMRAAVNKSMRAKVSTETGDSRQLRAQKQEQQGR